jgi:hypothetical protein
MDKEPVPFSREWFDDKLETLRVKWFMLDAQQKAVILTIGMYVASAILDILKTYIAANVNARSE